MRRTAVLALVPLMSLAFAGAPALWAADGGETATTPGSGPATAISATMSKKGRVHYGPSLNSKDAAILDAGTPVEVLGVAKGIPDWYAIRFPRQGLMWVHQKVLQPLEGGKTFRVTEDRARARDDSTLKGGIIAELAKGEIVESKERKNGDWQAVYAPSAVAYVHKSVLNLPASAIAAVPTQPQAEDTRVEGLWLESKAIYARYKHALDADLNLAATLDWTNLANLLDQVAKQHGSIHTRLEAQRLKDGIAKVVTAVEKVQRDNHVTPTRDIPGEAPIVVPKPEQVATVAPAPDKPAPTARPDQPATVTPKPETTPVAPTADAPALPATVVTGEELKQAREAAPKAPATVDFAVTGLLNEQATPQLGTNHVIIDQDGKVRAYLKVKPGATVQLSEYYWRLVGVKGETQEVDPAKLGAASKAPLVLVEDVMLLPQ